MTEEKERQERNFQRNSQLKTNSQFNVHESTIKNLRMENDSLKRKVSSGDSGFNRRVLELESEKEQLLRKIRVLEQPTNTSITKIQIQSDENNKLIQLYKEKLEQLKNEVQKLKYDNEDLRNQLHQSRLENAEKFVRSQSPRRNEPNVEILKIELEEQMQNNQMMQRQIAKL